jgi:hypothetical protein
MPKRPAHGSVPNRHTTSCGSGAQHARAAELEHQLRITEKHAAEKQE